MGTTITYKDHCIWGGENYEKDGVEDDDSGGDDDNYDEEDDDDMAQWHTQGSPHLSKEDFLICFKLINSIALLQMSKMLENIKLFKLVCWNIVVRIWRP